MFLELASPENLLEIQISAFHPRLAESETLGYASKLV